MKSAAEIPISELTPLELYTRISVCLLLADGRMDFEERETWSQSLDDLFPDHNVDHAFEILQSSVLYLNELSIEERTAHALDCARLIKRFYTENILKEKIYPKLEDMAKADGMVMSSEDQFLSEIQTIFDQY